jgi:hypothetical protein
MQRSTLAPNWREAALREHEERQDEQRAEAERLIATHMHARRGTVARGYVTEHRQVPRGLHHALSARHPTTRRKLLYDGALELWRMLHEFAEPPCKSTGARRVFGPTQAYWCKRLGLSMKRGKPGKNGRQREPNGARHVRTFLTQLEHLGIIRKGGRSFFEGRPGEQPRLVIWLQPWDDTLIARIADALAVAPPSENGAAPPTVSAPSVRIPGSGCFSDLSTPSPDGGGERGTGREEEGPSAPSISCVAPSPSTTPVDNPPSLALSPSENKERPSAAASDRPSAGANEGDRASSGPADVAEFNAARAVEVLGSGSLRVFSGAVLALVVQYLARTHRKPVDAAEGRSPRSLPSPGSAPRQARLGARPHPSPCMCGECQAWAAELVRGPAVALADPRRLSPPRSSTIRRPAKLDATPPPRGSVSPSPASSSPDEWADLAPAEIRAAILAELAHRGPTASYESLAAGVMSRRPLRTFEEATTTRVSWERGPDPADYPYSAEVDGERWKLRFNGPGLAMRRGDRKATPFERWRPLTLVVDGRELGELPVSAWPVRWARPGEVVPWMVDEED